MKTQVKFLDEELSIESLDMRYINKTLLNDSWYVNRWRVFKCSWYIVVAHELSWLVVWLAPPCMLKSILYSKKAIYKERNYDRYKL